MLQRFNAVNILISLGIGPSQSQIRMRGHHWSCPTHLKADWNVAANLPGLLTDLFPSGSGLTNHGSERMDITGDVHQSYLPIGSQTNEVVVATSNFQSPSGFGLHQSECIIPGHQW
jgi:hypothetical protein